jgi:SAM-dependent methyltransferase
MGERSERERARAAAGGTGEGALVAVPCPFCGAGERATEKVERGFPVVRCLGCGFCYVSPRPSQAALVCDYQDYLPDDWAGIDAWRRMMEPCERAAAALVEARVPPLARWSGEPVAAPGRARLLDVGCGYGFFLARMRERGYDARGVEPGETGARFARERLGLDVRSALLEEHPFPEGGFDVVTAFYVIEHVWDPLDLLRRVRAHLRPGGLLLLRYPDSRPVARLLSAVGLDRVPIYDAPFHLSAFDPGSIERFVRKAGFRDVEHAIGGHTLPPRAIERAISRVAGGLAGLLERASGGRLLLPGVSKCILARRPRD